MKSLNYFTNKIPIFILVLGLGVLMVSCSDEEAIFKSPDDVLERIDMVIEQDSDKEYIYLQNQQANSATDLVKFGYYGSDANKMDFTLQLDANRKLIFRIYNQVDPYFWTNENTSYTLYSNKNLNSVYRYVTAEISSNGETSYTSNLGNLFPSETQVDVFKIIQYDEEHHEMLVHFENFPLAHSSSSNLNTIMINGTFRGALTFNQ